MAQYEVTGPDGTKYQVTGPDGASNEEVLGQIDAYKQSQIQSAPQPNVPSSDVNAPVAPIRDPSFLGELGGGLKEMASSFSGLGKKQELVDTGSPVQDAFLNFINTPTAKLGLGAVRAAASPYAPADALAARAGAGTQDYLLSKGVNPTLAAALSTAADMGTNAALTLGTGLVKKGVEKLFPQTTENLANYLRPGRQAAKEARGAADTAAAKVDQGLAQTQSDVAFENARVQQQAKNLEASMPGKPEAEKLAGGVQAKDVGVKFQAHYGEQLAERKAQGNKLYDEALGPREAGAPSTVDKVQSKMGDEAMSKWDAWQKAKGTPEETAARDAYYNFLNADPATAGAKGEAPTLRGLHDQLLETRVEHRAATRAQNDNVARQLGIRENNILKKMDEVAPGSVAKLNAADRYYATDFAPYFSKGAITRAIADRDPSAIARNAIRPPSQSGKEVQTIDRVIELVGKDSPLHQDIARAHFGGLIDEASKAKDFRDGLIKAWDKYTNPRGNENEVLRKAYGKDYQNYEALVQQFRTAKSLDLKSAVKDAFNQGKSQLQQAGVTAEAQKKAIEANAKAQIEKVMGKPLDPGAGRMFGALLITEGLVHSALGNATRGGMEIMSGVGVIISRSALMKASQYTQGRSIIKALLRAAPGSNQAFANARLMQNFLQNLPKDQAVEGQQNK